MIAALIIFLVFCVVMVIIKSREPKQTKKPDATKGTRKVINITVGPSKLTTNPHEYYEKQRKRRNTRGARLDRHRRIWSVLFLTNSIYEFEQTKQRGYIDRQLLKQIESAKAVVLEHNPKTSDIKTAIRFIKIEVCRGKCDHPLTPSDIKRIMRIHDTAIPPIRS